VESSKIIKDLKEKNKRINKQKNDLILKNKKQKEVIKDYRLL
jgi:hypothetical protein